MTTTIVVAGGTGDLGGRITNALLDKGADVRALVRSTTDPAKVEKLVERGVQVVWVDLSDVAGLAQACVGASCVISALQGLRDVIVDAQSALLDAALAAGVPRFIPSDFSSDFTKLTVGDNRNFDLRREFNAHLDTKPGIAGTSILNGAFAELLTYNIPFLNFKKKQVGYWERADWRVDFTTMDNTAAFTAAAAMDSATPRVLRIASFQISANELTAVAREITGEDFTLVRMGSRDELAAYNKRERAAHPEGEQDVYPDWQRGQYMHSMFSVQNDPLDNNRYPDIHWTRVQEVLAKRR
ncbi:NmrA family protein [Spirosoma sp. KCTC 42546]|uniref:NmrA family NAD(P)-binding protein n=1 Tax=Spirosoma sp. KCTC 42546 TaxID=2520506 RepID=UPI001158B43B|nr:NmrA family NAD(P)-binding protein [Spirosoma sp. KCTC 42546]QDK81317.1 NmrA family protein [Spirosoma sp. KCTC 42546]